MYRVIDMETKTQYGVDCLSIEEAECLQSEHDRSVIINTETNEIIPDTKYRVVSDRRDYGLYQSYQEACRRLNDLVFEASCSYSEEQFWIEKE